LTRMRLTPILAFLIVLLAIQLVPVCHAQAEELKVVAKVQHYIQLEDGGLVIVNDTITLFPVGEEATLHELLVGIPIEFRENTLYATARSITEPSQRLLVEGDVKMWDENFYGVRVRFPEPITITRWSKYKLIVAFALTGLVSVEEEENHYFIRFPILPSLSVNASLCNVTLQLPSGTTVAPGGSHSMNITWAAENVFVRYLRENLGRFSGEGGWVRTIIPRLTLVECRALERKIALTGYGYIQVYDTYQLVNLGQNPLENLTVILPPDAHAIHGRGVIGDLEVSVTRDDVVEVLLIPEAKASRGQVTKFTVIYQLPFKNYVERVGDVYTLRFPLNSGVRWGVEELRVKVTLPNGARIIKVEPEAHFVSGGVFSDTAGIRIQDFTPIHDVTLTLSCRYTPIWAPLHPTLWAALLTIVAYGVAYAVRVPGPPAPIVPVPPETIRRFLRLYDKREAVLRELRAVEEEARRGRLPRSKYRTRRRRLEAELGKLSKEIEQLKETIREGGGRLADAIRSIEMAEAELEEVEAGIRRLRVRYRRREISSATYRRLLRDYEKRGEKARVAIDEALLRLREELG